MGTQEYYRTDSTDSTATMLKPEKESVVEITEKKTKYLLRRECSTLWMSVTVGIAILLVIVSDIALFIHFTAAISKVQTQGMSNELHCLQIINTMGGESIDAEFDLDEFNIKEPCQKLISSIKSYVTQVTGSVIQRENELDFRRNNTYPADIIPSRGNNPKSSAHLMLQTSSRLVRETSGDEKLASTSCRFPIQTWDNSNSLSHIQGIGYKNGRLKILQDGKYYIYSQIYFRFPQETSGTSPADSHHQMVQCIHKKTSYIKPILLLKGVGTKCWEPNALYGLHSIHHGGLFDLKSGDELFVSVSSLELVYAEGASSFFGAFKLDL
ncbi:tumor necrosis factor ligand superfamily member 10-like [Pelobates fuscus]|uniref:tumor necrosis factor ligand superfamily member 10-like n=1 Tax=Pelobates fuscus TaxID=191477 RepID=UPI002FE48901